MNTKSKWRARINNNNMWQVEERVWGIWIHRYDHNKLLYQYWDYDLLKEHTIKFIRNRLLKKKGRRILDETIWKLDK